MTKLREQLASRIARQVIKRMKFQERIGVPAMPRKFSFIIYDRLSVPQLRWKWKHKQTPRKPRLSKFRQRANVEKYFMSERRNAMNSYVIGMYDVGTK